MTRIHAKRIMIRKTRRSVVRSVKVAHNGLQLQEVGDFEALNCLPPLNLIRSTKLHLTTEPPIFCRCCYLLVFFFRSFRSVCVCNNISCLVNINKVLVNLNFCFSVFKFASIFKFKIYY